MRSKLVKIFSVIFCFLIVHGCNGAKAEPKIECGGVLVQGGLAICQTEPLATIRVGEAKLRADASGLFVFGLQRNSPTELELDITLPTGESVLHRLAVTLRHDEESVVNGVPCDKLDARTEEQKRQAGISWQKKQTAWGTFNAPKKIDWNFSAPAEGRISSPFGFSRRYVTKGCKEKVRPHLGYDIAAKTGTPVRAPTHGKVILSDDDLYYEGGTVFLDHGHGLVSIFLHLSKLHVDIGDDVSAGDLIGEIGATGTATGPHVHWGVKWRNVNSDQRKGDFYIDPSLLLNALEPPGES